jgi:hypothetical protein
VIHSSSLLVPSNLQLLSMVCQCYWFVDFLRNKQ